MDASLEPDRQAHYRGALQALIERVPTLHGAVLSRSDGFEVASTTRGDIAVSRLSALSSSMLALAQASLRELNLEGGGTVLIEGQTGKLLLTEVPLPAQPPLVLAVVGGEVMTGTLLWAARECAQALVAPFDTPVTPP